MIITDIIDDNEILQISEIELNNFIGNESYKFDQLKNAKNSIFIIAKNSSDIIAYMIVNIGLYEDELIKIFSKIKNQGIGTKLLNFYINKYKKNKKIFLEVRSKNRIAISFYKKNNFKIVSIRKNYYIDDDAIVMSL